MFFFLHTHIHILTSVQTCAHTHALYLYLKLKPFCFIFTLLATLPLNNICSHFPRSVDSLALLNEQVTISRWACSETQHPLMATWCCLCKGWGSQGAYLCAVCVKYLTDQLLQSAPGLQFLCWCFCTFCVYQLLSQYQSVILSCEHLTHQAVKFLTLLCLTFECLFSFAFLCVSL